MKTWLILYLFSMGSGDIIEAEDITVRATAQQCERIAVEKESEIRFELLGGNGVLHDVKVICQEVAQR